MFDNVGDYMKMYDVDDGQENGEIDKIFNADYNNAYNRINGDCDDIFSQASKSITEIYNKGSKSFYGMWPNNYIYHPLQTSALPQMIDVTNKKVFIVLGIFEYDSIPHDMKLLIFAESEEKARELIDETYSTDTSFFMVKNIKEA